MSSEDRVLGWGELLSPDYRVPTLTLALSIALHATNFFIFATLSPSVVADIGGLDLLSWATTLFVVSSIVSSAAGGILKAMLGARKSMLLAALGFGLGSGVTAIAPNMEIILVGRTIQGLGAGLLTAYSHGMVRDLFPPASWARMFAVVSGGWGIAALAGPLIGGIFAEYDIWRWGFGTMVIAAGLFIVLSLRAIPAGGGGERIGGWAPVLRLTLLGVSALLLGATGKFQVPGGAVTTLALSAGCFALTIALERGAAVPLFPRDMFRPTTVIGAGVLFVFGVTFATATTSIYGPLLFRVIHDIPIITTGFIVTAQSMFWTIAAIVFSGIGRGGSRAACAIGPAITGVGLLAVGLYLPAGPLWLAIAAVATIGFGIGLAWGHVGRFVLEAAGEADRNRVTSVMPTMQSIGIAFGSAAAGLVANANGFSQSLTAETAKSVAFWVYTGLSPAMLIALIGGARVALGTKAAADNGA
jgi:MFS family permease